MMTIDAAVIQEASIHLKEEGYAILPGVLTPNEVSLYRGETNRIYDEDAAAEAKGWRQNDADYLMYKDYGDHVFNLARKTRVFDDLYENPVVISVLEQVMEAKFILTQTEMRRPRKNVPAGSANVFHRDGRILADVDLWINAFWILEDVTKDNGPTTIIPCSHKSPVNEVYKNRKDDADEAAAGEAAADTAVKLIANAGDLVFMNSNTLHKAGKPVNDASRWVLIITYNQWFLKPAVDHTRMFTRTEVDAMSPVLRGLFGFTSIPPFDERKRMYTCRPWEEVSEEFVFQS